MNYKLNDSCPCKGCELRYLHCHDACVRYKEWKSELDEANRDHRAKKKEARNPHDDIMYSRLRHKKENIWKK